MIEIETITEQFRELLPQDVAIDVVERRADAVDYQVKTDKLSTPIDESLARLVARRALLPAAGSAARATRALRRRRVVRDAFAERGEAGLPHAERGAQRVEVVLQRAREAVDVGGVLVARVAERRELLLVLAPQPAQPLGRLRQLGLAGGAAQRPTRGKRGRRFDARVFKTQTG